GDAELAGDRLGGDRVVASNHPDLDAGRVSDGDRCLRFGPGRVDDPDEREEGQVADERQEIRGAGVEGGGIEIARPRGHDTEALRPEPLVLLRVAVTELVDRHLFARSVVAVLRPCEELVWSA